MTVATRPHHQPVDLKELARCDACGGTGELVDDCYECTGGLVESECCGEPDCPDCEGTGEAETSCSTCDESGTVTTDCGACDETGKDPEVDVDLTEAVIALLDDVNDIFEVMPGTWCCRSCSGSARHDRSVPFLGFTVQDVDRSKLGPVWLFHDLDVPGYDPDELFGKVAAAATARELTVEWDGDHDVRMTVSVAPSS